MSGGTNSNIKKGNKQIKKQYQYDKAYRDFTIDTSKDRFEEAQLKVDTARDQEETNREFRDDTNQLDYQYKKDLRKQDKEAQEAAFEKSKDVYNDQLDLNTTAAALTLESEQRRLDEALLAATFQEKDLKIDLTANQAAAGFSKEASQLERKSAFQENILGKDASELERTFARSDNLLGKESNQLERVNAAATTTLGKEASQLERDRATDATLFGKEATQLQRDSAAASTTNEKERLSLERDEKIAQNKINTSRLQSIYDHDGRVYTIQQAQMDRESSKIGSNEGWGLEGNTLQFQQAAAKNLANRIDNRVELIRTKGAMLARGVEGNTVTALTQSALADYGRKQAASALDLIFSTTQKSLSDRKTKGTAIFDKGDVTSKKSISKIGREKSTSILGFEKEKITVDDKYIKEKTTNKQSKLDQALAETLSQLDLSDRKLDNEQAAAISKADLSDRQLDAAEAAIVSKADLNDRKLDAALGKTFSKAGLTDRQLDSALGKTLSNAELTDRQVDSKLATQTQKYNFSIVEKIQATKTSAQAEFTASEQKLGLDKDVADLKAFGQKMIKPKKPPLIPKPLKLPETIFIDPTKPRKPPKPVKGTLGKTSVWNTVSDGLGVMGQIASIAAPFVSDIKTKHTVEPIENASTKLSSLKPVSFYYTPEYTAEPDRLHHGFVAQEYKEVMPDATYDLKGTLAIDTNDLIGLLVKGHQELQEKIVQLEDKLSATN